MQEAELELLIKKVLSNMDINNVSKNSVANNNVSSNSSSSFLDDSPLEDLGDMDFKKEMRVPNPQNLDMYMKLKQATPGRIGIWRSGPRYTTRTMLRFRADHATAQDTVFKDVPEEFIKENGWWSVQTRCTSKDMFLTRPDLGRRLNEEGVKMVQEKCQKSPKVEIYVADGLSSMAVMTNAKTTLQSIEQSLKSYNLTIGTPFFVRYGRVGVMDEIGELLDADVVCTLIGERPGLITDESMSCYMAYRPTIGMPESRRTVVSNIHSGGMPALEAGAYIADLVKKMLEQKVSGIELK